MPTEELFIPPQSIEEEQAVLGLMMAKESALHDAPEYVCATDFYRPAHQDVFEALLAIVERKEIVDLISVQEELRGREKLDEIGGTEYLMALIDRSMLAYDVKQHAARVKSLSLRRQVIAEAHALIGTAMHDADCDPVAAITEAALRFDAGMTGGARSLKDLTGIVWDQFEAYHSGGQKRGLPFGIEKLDWLTYGVGPGEFVVIGGRPSEGKTVLLTQLCISAAKQGTPILFFSSEMSGEEIVERALMMEGRLDATKVRAGRFEDDDWARAGHAANTMYELDVVIDDLPASTTSIVSRTRRAILQRSVGLVLVDYLQLVECPGRSENRNVEVGKINATLKRLARSTGVPVVAAAQLNRSNKKENRKPQLSDLREGGNMEGDADKVILIHNPHLEAFGELESSVGATRVQAQLIVAKHRGGPKGTVTTWFTPASTRFDMCETTFEEPGKKASSALESSWWSE